ncbi:MAG: amidohydrolase family protein [Pseudomonadota bacterium]
MPNFPIVDSHVHFWDRAQVPISWTEGLAIHRPFYPADLDADRGAVELDAIVFVETNVDGGQHVQEADFVGKLAAADPRIKAIVAHAPLNGATLEADLKALSDRPLVRGIRHLIQGEDEEALTTDPHFREGLRQLPRFGFHFEICILHHQFGAALRLMEAAPDVTYVMDHIAKPGIKAGIREPWWQQIKQLSAFTNVTCKLSGVATEADHANWQEDELRTYIDRVIEVFGPDRIMFGSDWPVMRLATSYPRWVEIVELALSSFSEADQRKVFAENAKKVYRL